MTIKFTAENIWKKFNHGYIFKKINFEAESGQIVAISGHNGAGKTTFLKILTGNMTPDKGRLLIQMNGRTYGKPLFGMVGLLGPYLELYDNLTARENLDFFGRQMGLNLCTENFESILNKVGLSRRMDDMVGDFSSGMKQRMKYAVLYLKEFPVIMLDEPTSNFDDAGRELFHQFLKENKKSLIFIASNLQEEVKLGEVLVELG